MEIKFLYIQGIFDNIYINFKKRIYYIKLLIELYEYNKLNIIK